MYGHTSLLQLHDAKSCLYFAFRKTDRCGIKKTELLISRHYDKNASLDTVTNKPQRADHRHHLYIEPRASRIFPFIYVMDDIDMDDASTSTVFLIS